MRYRLANDAKPQVKLLLIATAITVALWFIPYADYLVYPIRLFVTFIHEGSHVLASLLTGGTVQSMTVSSDGSGLVQSLTSSPLAVLLTSSAGYVGAIAYGTLLLFLIRRTYSARIILAATAGFIGLMTIVFGFFAPVWHVFSADINFTSLVFTIFSGVLLTVGLLGISKYASAWWANFTLAFLAVQCLLNAVYDLATLFLINSPLVGSHIHSDAANMAAVTGVPSIVWVVLWILVSIFLISVGLRIYAVASESKNHDLPFND